MVCREHRCHCSVLHVVSIFTIFLSLLFPIPFKFVRKGGPIKTKSFPGNKTVCFTPCRIKNLYRPPCRENATAGDISGGIEPVLFPNLFRVRLFQAFHNRRVALLGDSLTRQWFETLFCRLGTTPNYFLKSSSPPERMKRAAGEGIYFSDIHAAPKNLVGKGGITGYAMSSSTATSNVSIESAPCVNLNSTIEYYHLDRLQERAPAREMFDFIVKDSDLVIVNIGAHYRMELKTLEKHIQRLMELCGKVNSERRWMSKRCFFRETSPTHFQFKSKPNGDWEPNATLRGYEGHGCGPMSNATIPANLKLEAYGKLFQVPIIKASVLNSAWRWHYNPENKKESTADTTAKMMRSGI